MPQISEEEKQELLNEFFLDLDEHFENIEVNLFKIEKEPDNHSFVNELFRSFHTIKGNAGFFQFNQYVEVCHIVENMLKILRDKELMPNSRSTDVLFQSLDVLQQITNKLKANDTSVTDIEDIKKNVEAVIAELNKEVPVVIKNPQDMTPQKDKSALNPHTKFGTYLVNKGFIKNSDVIECLHIQKKNVRPLGSIALQEKLLNMKQVMKILHDQTDTPKIFGEVGVSLGYLKEDDVSFLLQKQKELHKQIGEILVDMGKISKKILETQLVEYFEFIGKK